MSHAECWGIFREREHSPGRECDDAEILRLTAKHLEARGFTVVLKTAEEVVGTTEPPPRWVFLMCERLPVLRLLRDWAGRGIGQVNTPPAVLNTYRDRMIAQFEEGNVPFVPSRLVSTLEPNGHRGLPVWVKRGDVHNTQEGDVVFAASEGEIQGALDGLAGRGIPRAVLQEHVEGDLIKFYGIGEGLAGQPAWFRWFYHKDQQLAGHPFDQERLATLVRKAAAALGLEVYGGDVIATREGRLVLIDLNAWPSFALYRDEAAARIARYLATRFRGDSA